MKKIYLILAAAALMGAAAACQKNDFLAPEDELAPQSVTVKITVSDLEPGSRAVKKGWTNGDIINVYLDDTDSGSESAYVPDFTLTYDGGIWSSSELAPAVIARLKASGGFLHGFWEGSNSAISSWEHGGTNILFPCNDNGGIYDFVIPLVAEFNNISYTYEGGILTANINTWRLRTNFQLVVSGLTYEAGRYTLYADGINNVTSIDIFNSGGPECYTWYGGTGMSEGRIAGIPNEDGVAFVGGIISTASENYVFNMKDNTTGVVYTFDKTAALNHAGCTKVVAAKVPFNKFYVKMGLSVNWSALNLGATSYFPTADTDEARQATWGDYYAWGEIETYYTPGHAYLITSFEDWKSGKENGYDWASYKFDDTGFGNGLTKYLSGGTDFSTLQSADDVASTLLKGSWRMPTYDDWEELKNWANCEWEWDATNKGYKVTSLKTGYTSQYIFLPAAGSWSGNAELINPGTEGDYWSSSLCTSMGDGKLPNGISFDQVNYSATIVMRYLGNSIRPVRP